MNKPRDLYDLMPVICAVCGGSAMRATLGKASETKLHIRVECPEHGPMVQLPLDYKEYAKWAHGVISRFN